MSLQFADLDADGMKDMITATFEGHAFVSYRKKSGWSKPTIINDSQGRPVRLSFYYDNEARGYKTISYAGIDGTKTKAHMVSAQVFDWDADGDYDLLLGAKDGQLYLQRNEGTNKKYSFTGKNELLFTVPGGLTAARPVDWNGDGLTDLVCGSFQKDVRVYLNSGEQGAPVFGDSQVILPKPELTPGGALEPNDGRYATPIDWNNDGKLDLLVGGYARYMPQMPELNAKQKAHLEQLDAERREVSQKLMKIYREIQEETKGMERADAAKIRRARYEKPDFKELSKKNSELYKEISKLRPGQKRDSGVWVYLQQQS